ncbi:MAG: hypothetical protein EPO30_00555 [Lysobacteraceae bacterium]|nr:MAG: hypothetical protein EPO30_00555 [Xanthomonadaceae bacterium]
MRAIAPLLLPATFAAAACLLAACSGPAEPPPAAADAAATAPSADAGPATGNETPRDNTGVTMRYTCDAETEVTVLADGTARVSLPDGQQVTISRIAGSAPPVFTGGSLYFTVGEQDARLSQEQEANELTCAPA